MEGGVMAYYAEGDGQSNRNRACVFELIRNSAGARTSIMTHALYIPQAWDVTDISGDTFKASAPGKHFITRVGWTMSQYRVSGKIPQSSLAGTLNGKRITGESVFKSLKDLWDIFQAKPPYRAGPDSAFLPGGEEPVPLDELEMNFYNLDEPESDGRAGEGGYRIQWASNGGFTYRRQAGRLEYVYSMSFVCLELANPSEAATATAADYARQFEAAYATFASDAAWAFAADAGQRLLREGIDAMRFRKAARDAMKSKPWTANAPVDVPAGMTEAALAALQALGAGI